MPYYLFQASYTPEALASLIKKPQDRRAVVTAAVEKIGGKVEGAWLAFGESDVVLICQLPDNTSAAAFALTVGAGGALKSTKTTPLFSFEEGQAAMKKAAQSGYRPPGESDAVRRKSGWSSIPTRRRDRT